MIDPELLRFLPARILVDERGFAKTMIERASASPDFLAAPCCGVTAEGPFAGDRDLGLDNTLPSQELSRTQRRLKPIVQVDLRALE